MIKQILNSPSVPKHIIATCRSLKAENAQELQKLAEKNSNLHVLELDMADVSGPRLPELVKQVSEIVQESGLNLLVNNAGMSLHKKFDELDADSLLSTFNVNTVAPCMVSKAFRPLLKRAADKKQSDQQAKAAVVNISSIMASMDNCTNGNALAYKVSKAALNMVTRGLSAEFAGDGITVVSLHPGWVQTDMGGSRATLTVDESVVGMIKVISLLENSQTGSFLCYDGSILPW
jgi:NAD(P)-dependent dehydrogenase (short-subunit alcohol dehydrogenase family)